ncbi:vitrin-like [Pyxicephalus adspersus]|uniref:vitrin-like n=1 Tax=Pyxicephalus adspersus TaxID=30357 RepID=UPI003B5CA225
MSLTSRTTLPSSTNTPITTGYSASTTVPTTTIAVVANIAPISDTLLSSSSNYLSADTVVAADTLFAADVPITADSTIKTEPQTTAETPYDVGSISCFTHLDLLSGGDQIRVWCPAYCDSYSYSVWGTDTYTSDSAICPAAIHAGVMPVIGGYVTLNRVSNLIYYYGSARNGIKTMSTSVSSYESYVFI